MYLRSFFLLLLKGLFITASFSNNIHAVDKQISICSSNRVSKNRLLLDRKPKVFWNDNKPNFEWGVQGQNNPVITRGGYQSKGSAGVIPYITYQGKKYILLSRETWGEAKKMYCDLGGAAEAYGKNKSSFYVDTFLATLIKETEEESGGLYKITESEILKKAYTFSYI